MAGVFDMSSEGPNYPIESVANAARVILMLRSQPILRVAEVATALGVARSSAHRMLTTLQAQGLLRQDPTTRGYRPGPLLVELGLAVIGASDLRAEARPTLESVAKECGETVHLIVLEGTDIVFLDCVESLQAIRAGARTGDRAPAHAAAAGKALLAELPLHELRQLYPTSRLVGGTENALRTRRQLEAELDVVRARGYSTNFAESENGLHAVAAVIRAWHGPARGAIAVSAPAHRLPSANADGVASILLAALARLENAAG